MASTPDAPELAAPTAPVKAPVIRLGSDTNDNINQKKGLRKLKIGLSTEESTSLNT